MAHIQQKGAYILSEILNIYLKVLINEFFIKISNSQSALNPSRSFFRGFLLFFWESLWRLFFHWMKFTHGSFTHWPFALYFTDWTRPQTESLSLGKNYNQITMKKNFHISLILNGIGGDSLPINSLLEMHIVQIPQNDNRRQPFPKKETHKKFFRSFLTYPWVVPCNHRTHIFSSPESALPSSLSGNRLGANRSSSWQSGSKTANSSSEWFRPSKTTTAHFSGSHSAISTVSLVLLDYIIE